MNAGLQCLLSNCQLVSVMLDAISRKEVCGLHDIDTIAVQFACVLHKTWCGKYSSLHPSKFKQKLGSCFPQFKDFRQVSYVIVETQYSNL